MASIKNKIARSRVLRASRKACNRVRRGLCDYGPKVVRRREPVHEAWLLASAKLRKWGGYG